MDLSEKTIPDFSISAAEPITFAEDLAFSPPLSPYCSLCGLDIGRRPFERDLQGEKKFFCCLGCMNVYSILLESGVIAAGQDVRETEIFKRSLALGLISNGNKKKPQTAIPADTPVTETLLQVSGMWCASCAWLIEHALAGERGIVSVEAFFASDLVKVRYCPQYVPPGKIEERIRALGYTASEFNGDNDRAWMEKRDLLLRLGVAGFFWMNIMTLSTALYVGYFEQISDSIRRYLPLVLMVLAIPIVFYSAMPILRLAWQGMRAGVARMESLLGIGILAAFVYSTIEAFRGGPHVYFDTASAIVTLVLLGKLIERNAKEYTTRAITTLYRMMPKKVRLLAGGEERFVTIEALSPGDLFIVKAGERIPADGIVFEGQSFADESLLTGESTPVEKEPGAAVIAGSVNAASVLQVRATKVGEDSTLAQIIKLVEYALGSRTAIERTVDQVSRVFVPGVIVLAAASFLVLWLGGFTSAGEALMRAITVLVIACPCALGMATPLAITSAIGTASRKGILVSDSSVLETIRKVDTVVFDKTGTVTEGDFTLIDSYVVAAPACAGLAQSFAIQGGMQTLFDAEYLPLLAALERYSEHPLGRTVVRKADEMGLAVREAEKVQVVKGQGIIGLVGPQRVFAGNRRLVDAETSAGDFTDPFANEALEQIARDWEEMGRSVVYFGIDRRLCGVMAFGDRIRPEAADVVRQLKRRGIEVVLLSGDAEDTTRAIAREIGADDAIAEALPEEKIRVVERLQERGRIVAMIGDGINDAPALARANLSIAMGAGADLAMRAASVVLMQNSLDRTLDAFSLAEMTGRVVRQNLFWAFLYNTLGISLAVTGILNPILAAGAMLLSSLSVIGNSMRLSRKN